MIQIKAITFKIEFTRKRYFNSTTLLIKDKIIILKYSKLLKAPVTSPSLKGRKDQFILSKGTKNNPLAKEKNI
jgi:hypothetical protein